MSNISSSNRVIFQGTWWELSNAAHQLPEHDLSFQGVTEITFQNGATQRFTFGCFIPDMSFTRFEVENGQRKWTFYTDRSKDFENQSPIQRIQILRGVNLKRTFSQTL